MSNWEQPICGRCWSERIPDREPVPIMDPDGFEPRVETCAWCGYETVDGFYVRVDPTRVPFPTLEYYEDDIVREVWE